MRAIIYDRTGGPDVLQQVEIPTRQPGPGEVRVAIYWSGVNPTDWKSRQGAGDGSAVDPSQTLTFVAGRWLNATTYVATYDVRDANVVVPPVDVGVSGGRGTNGLGQQPAAFPAVFRRSTRS